MKKWIAYIFVGLFLTIAACDKKDEGIRPKVTSEDIKNEDKDAVIVLTENVRKERDEFIKKTQDEMGELSGQVEKLKQKIELETGDVKEKLKQQLQHVSQERDEVEAKIAAMKSETGENWRELKAGVTEAVNRLKQTIQKVKDENV